MEFALELAKIVITPMSSSSTLIGSRLKETMRSRGMTATELARMAEVKTSFIYDVISGKSLHPSTVTLARVAEVLGVSLHYLAGADNENTARGGLPSNDPQYVALPRLRVDVSAGGGAVVSSEECGDHYYFRRSWIRNRLMAAPNDLRLVSVRGDSMSPTLEDGDIILVDIRKTTASPPGIFVLFDGFGLVAKRLEYVPGIEPPTLRVISDNPQYGAYERPVAETRIIGRVVWFAREI
jgi:phage repressor protein C with HTH and peptisase S24 domain